MASRNLVKKATMNELYLIISSLIIFFILLGIGISSFVLYYNKKRKDHLREKELLYKNFENSLLHSKVELQEQIFTRISEEIHDNVGQILSLAKVQLNILEQTTPIQNSSLNAAKEHVSQAISDLRDIAHSLNGERVQSLSLEIALQEEVRKINQSCLLTAILKIEGEPKQISIQKKLILYRMIQEALHNCLKHANASVIEVLVIYMESCCTINVTDNGCGFSLDKKPGLGLTNLKNRAQVIGGEMQIQTSPQGTQLTIIFPY
jgi:two-component system NarL family sensor kinase